MLQVLHCAVGLVRAPVITTGTCITRVPKCSLHGEAAGLPHADHLQRSADEPWHPWHSPLVYASGLSGAVTALQVASRIWVLWGIVLLVPDETTQGSIRQLGPLSPTVTSLVGAWAVSEIIRYGFFAAKASLTSLQFRLIILDSSAATRMYMLWSGCRISYVCPVVRQLRKFRRPRTLRHVAQRSAAAGCAQLGSSIGFVQRRRCRRSCSRWASIRTRCCGCDTPASWCCTPWASAASSPWQRWR